MDRGKSNAEKRIANERLMKNKGSEKPMGPETCRRHAMKNVQARLELEEMLSLNERAVDETKRRVGA